PSAARRAVLCADRAALPAHLRSRARSGILSPASVRGCCATPTWVGRRMIDLHCHMLPGIDDGAPTLEVALAMARCAVADGITVTACTPHIYPGLYDNDREGIARAISALQD